MMKKLYSPFFFRTAFVVLLMLTFVKGWGQATLPLTRTTWNSTPTGWTDAAGGSYTTTFACSGSNGARFDASTQNYVVNLDSSPNELSFVVKSNAATTSSLLVQESDDGTTFTNIANLSGTANLPTTCTLKGPYILKSATRYVKWIFTKGSQNMTMDDVNITKATSISPALAITGTSAHGAICVGTPAISQTYTITNSGSTAASGVTVVSNNPEFVVSGLSSTTIAANGGTATYTVTFTPTAAGARTATVTVTSTTSGSNAPTSSLTGTGTAIALGTVTTNAVGTITARSAVLNGTVNNIGSCPSISERGFVYSQTSTNGDPANGGTGVTTVPVTGITATSFTNTPNTLLPLTQYTYKAYVLNGSTYTYGTPVTFTTSPALEVTGTYTHDSSCPSVSAAPLTYRITNNSVATVTGINVSSDNTEFVVGGATATSLAPGAFTTYTITFTPASSGIMSSTISTASSQPTITNTVTGTGTTPVAASVTTGAETLNTTGTTATLNASAATLGVCPATTAKGFVISRTSDNATPTVGGSGVTNESVTPLGGNGAYLKAITSLTVNTNYSYRAYLYDGVTYTYGAVVTFTTPLVSSASDYFRSNVVTGTWATPASWQSSATGGAADSEWMTATLAPNASANSITIRAGHTITSSASAASRNMTIENSGILILNNTFTVNGANIINGTLTRNSAATTFTTTGSSLAFGATGIYNHNLNAAAIPTATWSVNSICNITGVTTSITLSSLNQTFGNFTWNNTGQTAPIDLPAAVNNFNVSGNLTVLSTNTGAFNLNNSTTNKILNIGNLIVSNNSRFRLSFSTATTTGSTTVNVGNVTVNDTALLDFGGNIASGPTDSFYGLPVRGILNLSGNLIASSTSTIRVSGNNDSYGIINFINSQPQTVDVKSNVTAAILFHTLPNSNVVLQSNFALGGFNGFDIEGSLDLGTHTITGADGDFNYFYNYPNSTLRIAHPDGIASLLTYPTTGAVRVDANSEGYDIDGNYVYYGISNQITGNGLPEIIKSITVENTGTSGNNEVTLTNAELGVTDDLIVSNGIFNINNKEVYGGGVAASELRINADSELKIGGTRSFPLDFGAVTFAPLSTVHYAGQDQSVANLNSTTYLNLPSYENLKISGTGIKSPLTDLTVNNITTVTAGVLEIKETADAVIPHVFTAKKGIQKTGGSVILANNSQLIQDADAVNSGNIEAQRKVYALNNNITTGMDYVYWSSPVKGNGTTIGQTLRGSFSPNTPANEFKQYRESDNRFISTPDVTFKTGKGYAIRAEDGAVNPYSKTYSFTGEPNNGSFDGELILKSSGGGYNLVGNPYPSNLDLDELFTLNQTSIYNVALMWTNKAYEMYQQGSNYNGNNYAIYNKSGGNPSTSYGSAFETVDNIIKVGQSFIVQAKTGGALLSYNNTVRDTKAGTWYERNNSDKNRYWLQLISPQEVVNTILVGYFDDATNDFDSDYDARLLNAPSDIIYSYLGNQKLLIQGKSIFNDGDKVILGSSQNLVGNYTIKLASKEGVFANGQAIYLHDKSNNTYTNLQNTDFVFSAQQGALTGRFEIVYKSATLSTGSNTKENLVVYRDNEYFIVKSSYHKIDNIDIYDGVGRLVKSIKGNSPEVKIDTATLSSGIYFLNINRNNEIINKKIIK